MMLALTNDAMYVSIVLVLLLGLRVIRPGPLSIQDRIVVRPEIVSELRSRNTDHLDSREINDIECRALAMLREHSMLHPARNSRKSNKNKPCRRDGHDTRTEKSPERSPNPTDDRLSSDDGPDSSDPDTSARAMDVEHTVSPGRCITLNRRSTRLSHAKRKRGSTRPTSRKRGRAEETRQAAQSTRQGKTWMKEMQMGPNFTMSIREGNC